MVKQNIFIAAVLMLAVWLTTCLVLIEAQTSELSTYVCYVCTECTDPARVYR